MPNFLIQKSRGAAGNQQVYVSTNATETLFGDDLGVAAEAYSVGDAPRNRVQQMLGTVYSIGSDGIYTKDNALVSAGPSTKQHTFGTLTGGPADTVATNRKTGLHAVTINNIPYLVMAYGTDTADTNWTGLRFNTSSLAWQETGDIALAAAGTEVIAEIVYRNKLYWITGPAVAQGHRLNIYDPKELTIEQVNLDDGGVEGFQDSAGNLSLSILNDKLYVFGLDMFSGSEEWHIAELSDTTLTRLTTVQSIAAVGAAATDGKPGFFTDKTYLYCFIWDDNATAGWNAYRVASSGTVTPVNTVLPIALRKGAGPPTPTQARWAATYDPGTTPGTLDIYFWYADDGSEGTPWSLYKWVDGSPGNETEMTFVDAGGDVAHSIPSMITMTGGERIFTPGEMGILITGRDPVLNGVKIRFKAFGDPGGGATKTVEFRYDIQSEPTLALCTLKNPVFGGSAILSGNTVANVTADNVTEYSVVWDVSADGISGGQAQLTAYISI